MKRRRWNAPLLALLTCFPKAAYPQLGEVQVGPLVSIGGESSYGLGAGLALGVAAGRLVYVGLRWSYQAGSTQQLTASETTVEVRSRVQLFTADLAVLIPAGALDVVPGATLGVAWFAQHAGGAAAGSFRTAKFTAGPSLSVQAHMAGLVFVPEIQYLWAGDPELPWQIAHQGPVASLRLVIPFEVDRIRH